MAQPAFTVVPDAFAELAVPGPRYLENAAWRNGTFLAWAGALGLGLLALSQVAAADDLPLAPLVLRSGSVPVLLAVMAAILFRQGGIDLSVGAMIGLCATVFGALTSRQTPIPVALAAALAIGFGVGLGHALLVGVLRVPGFLATLPSIALARAIAWFATEDGQPIQAFASQGDGMLSAANAAGWTLALALLVVGMWTVQFRPLRPRPGSAPAPLASLLRGLPYLASSLIAAVAGVLLVIRTGGATQNYGNASEQEAIIAAVVGGSWLAGRRVNCLGAFLAALLLHGVQQASAGLVQGGFEIMVLGKALVGFAGVLLAALVQWVVSLVYAGGGAPAPTVPAPPPAG